MRQQCKNNKLKIIAPIWNDEFDHRGSKETENNSEKQPCFGN